ncbi:MAG TPA: hypothetical protein VFL80_08875 [Thermoanaerobaculia bacterium]|nr:hypothetical protein [Thermoanaerobaculia bacterium]
MVARIRKHRTALIGAAVFNLIVFFPVLFMGRVLSPNDVFWNFDPWALYREGPVQNSLLNDPPTSYYTTMQMLKTHRAALHWNPYIASGSPGMLATGVMAPFVLLPVLLFPLIWSYTLIVFLKFNVAFFFGYLWLREEKMGKAAAAIGAVILAGAAPYAVRWLWQITNATAMYPAIFWCIRRTLSGKRVPVALTAIIALFYAVAAYPAAMAYGVYLAAAYAAFIILRERRLPLRPMAAALGGVLLALAIAAPNLTTYSRFLLGTGYLGVRKTVSFEIAYPLSHWRSFLWSERLGNHAVKNWIGSRTLHPILNNYIEATIYLGLPALVLMALALGRRRSAARWFWLCALLVIALAIFAIRPVASIVGTLPGIKYSPLSRMVLLLPVAAAFLAAAGAAWLLSRLRRVNRFAAQVAAAVIAIGIAADLAILAGRFHPYLEPKHAVIRHTPTTRFLASQPRPFRIAPMMDYLWPNSSEMYRLEDLRSHFASEAVYRRLLKRIDPRVTESASTVLQFDSRTFNFTDPLVGVLGVRYLVEHKAIDIIKWTTFAATVPGVKEVGALTIRPGQTLQRTIRVEEEPFWAVELPVGIDPSTPPTATFVVRLLRFGAVVYERAFSPFDIAAMNKIYIPLRPYARLGDEVILQIVSSGFTGTLLTADGAPGESPIFFGRVKTPIIFDRELPDGRIFLNLAEQPRFRVARRLRKMERDEFLAERSLDLSETTVITDRSVAPPNDSPPSAHVSLVRYTPAEQRLESDSPAPFFLASSEKLTPELRITVDGERARPVEINGLFAGVQVPAGKRDIRFQRRVGRGYLVLSAAALIALGVIAGAEMFSAARRRPRSGRRRGHATGA